VVSLPINYLSPNTTYYFQVRGGNGCATGDWSNSLMTKTDGVEVMSIEEADRETIVKPSPTKTPTPTPIRQEVEEVRETVVPEMENETDNESVWEKIGGFFKSIF